MQVYHDLVPVICDLLGGHRRRITTALLGGSLLPLAMFVTWNAVTLAVMPSAVRKRPNASDRLEAAAPHATLCLITHVGRMDQTKVLRWHWEAVLCQWPAPLFWHCCSPWHVRQRGELFRGEFWHGISCACCGDANSLRLAHSYPTLVTTALH